MAEADHALIERLARDVHGLELVSEASDRIVRFLDLLAVWNPRLRLTGERDRGTLVRKHVVDVLACVALLPDSGGVLDLGTGAGLPGAVLACVRPDLDTTLLDSRERSASFLGEVVRTIPLPRARALAMRAEDAASDAALAGQQRLVTSRAVRMDRFLGWAAPLRAGDGRIVAMQTPRVSRAEAQECGAPHGLRVIELRDYRLPDGEPRRLVVFALNRPVAVHRANAVC